MFESIVNFFKSLGKSKEESKSKDAAKERLHLVLMQDRANISADFLALMKQEIIEVIKKYIDVDENAIDVRLTNKSNEDGTTGAPVLYANIPIVSVKEEAKAEARKIGVDTAVQDPKKNQEKEEKEKKTDVVEDNSIAQEEKKKTQKINTNHVENNIDEEVEKDSSEGNSSTEEEKTKEVIEKAEEIVEEIKEEVEKENTKK